jgi:CBS domain-containing protein
MASTILVKDIMSKDVKVVRTDTSSQKVVATLNKLSIGSVVVVQKEKPVGIMTIRDILVRIVEKYLAPKQVRL